MFMFILYLNQLLHLDLPNLQLNMVSGPGSNYFHHILVREIMFYYEEYKAEPKTDSSWAL